MSGALPKGWTTATIADVTKTVPNAKPEDSPENEFGYVDISAIDNSSFSITEVKRFKGKDAPSRARRPIQPNDVLFSNVRTYLRNVALVGPHCPAELCSTGFTVLRPNTASEPRYLFRYVLTKDFIDRVTPQQTGTHYPATSDRVVMAEHIALPPLAEQRWIGAKVETLLGKVDACQQRLAKIPVLLKRFRQAVLAAACSGRLTADWREENPKHESGADLQARIKAGRLKTALSTKEKNQIAEAFQDERLTVGDNELGVESFPDSWIPCRIGAIGTVVNGSTPSRKQDKFWGGNIPWVSSGEVRNNLISTTRERITKAGYDGCSVRLLPRGTVLLAMIGEGKTRGQSSILHIEATINQNIAAILIPHGLVDSGFLWRWFQLQYEATRERGGGSGPQALNCQRVRELPFVLPPVAEQQGIVRRVEALFALADEVEARLQQAQAHVDELTPSLLARAFSGRLVPQDPDHEPASVLLHRVRQSAKEGNDEH
jgi:type I restriction enzyme S subunit